MTTPKKPGPKSHGSAYRNAKGRWCFRFMLPTGKPKQVTLGPEHDRLSDAKVREMSLAWTERAKTDPRFLERGEIPTPEPATVADVIDLWLPLIEASDKLRPATKKQHRTSAKRIKERFGPRPLADIKTGDLRAWVRELAAKHAPSTVHNTFNSLGRMWDDAEAENWIECANLCRNRKVREEQVIHHRTRHLTPIGGEADQGKLV